MTLLLELSAVAPSLLLLWYFHSRDVYPEPPRVVWTTFFLGVLATIPVMIVAPIISGMFRIEAIVHPFKYGLAVSFLLAAIPEEYFKYLILTRYAARHKAFDEPMDGVVYGTAASLGFAALENILYVSEGGFGLAVMRAVTAVPGHALLGVIMGFYVGRARFDPERGRRWLRLALVIPILLHGLYDFPLISLRAMTRIPVEPTGAMALLGWMAILVLVVEVVWALRLLRRLRAAQLRTAGVRPKASLWPARLALIFGGLAAAGGGMVLLSLLASLVLGAITPARVQAALTTLVILGIVPTTLGLSFFMWGLGKINRAGSRRS